MSFSQEIWLLSMGKMEEGIKYYFSLLGESRIKLGLLDLEFNRN